MNWLFESPLTILIGAIAALVLLGIAWVQTGRRELLYGAIGVLLLGGLLLMVERYVETAGEQVTKTLYRLAGEIVANDGPAVAAEIVSSKPELKTRAQREMERAVFSDVTISKIHEIESFPNKQPPQVVVNFNVLVSGTIKPGGSFSNHPIYFRLTFWQDHDGQYRLADYKYDLDQPYPRASGRMD